MRTTWWVATAMLASSAVSAGPASDLLQELESRESSPAFRRAVVFYQTLRETYENWHTLPSGQPLAEVLDGYQELIEGGEPMVAAAALDRMFQLTFDMMPQDRVLSRLRALHLDEAVVAASGTFNNPSSKQAFGDHAVEVRGLRLGELEDGRIIHISFEVRSRSGKAERLALDLRVMNEVHNYQTAAFFEVGKGGWQRQETTLGEMFSAHDEESTYEVLPGHSLARATFGSVPEAYDAGPRADVAFENQFYRYYWVRRGEAD